MIASFFVLKSISSKNWMEYRWKAECQKESLNE